MFYCFIFICILFNLVFFHNLNYIAFITFFCTLFRLYSLQAFTNKQTNKSHNKYKAVTGKYNIPEQTSLVYIHSHTITVVPFCQLALVCAFLGDGLLNYICFNIEFIFDVACKRKNRTQVQKTLQLQRNGIGHLCSQQNSSRLSLKLVFLFSITFDLYTIFNNLCIKSYTLEFLFMLQLVMDLATIVLR